MSGTDREYLRRAFELSYFIHPNTKVALRIAEAAVCKLDYTIGRQGRRSHYVPDDRRSQGLLRRSLRATKINLSEEHLLQLLVYTESDSWERSSEYGYSSRPLTAEDLVIRFIKRLVQITVKRNSFYVTLGIGRLLYEYETSQVRQMYDVLMQDQARFKDNSYLRKQKKVLIREMIEHFDRMIRTIRTSQGEDRFLSQPLTGHMINLVRECLVRFTPWNSSCVIPERFDPLGKIPALYFSRAESDDESQIEMNRIHTIIDPNCFSRLIQSLGFAPPDERLRVPQFFYSDNAPPPGDRFNPPPLTEKHNLRLERARKTAARRRKTYRVGQMRIYVDDVERITFDPRLMRAVKFKLSDGADVIEVRGEDSNGDLPLAILLVPEDDFAPGQSLKDSIKLEGGQEFTITLTPQRTATGELEELQIEVSYAETQPMRAIAWLLQRGWFGILHATRFRGKELEEIKTDYLWLTSIAIASALVLVVSFIVWRTLKSRHHDLLPPRQVEVLPTPTIEFSPVLPPTQPPKSTPNPRTPVVQIARATWNHDPHAIDNAIRLELRRGNPPSIEVSNSQTTLLFAVNKADPEDHVYVRYRITVSARDTAVWERTIQSPKVISARRAHVLTLELSPREFPKADFYSLRIEGETQTGWQIVGEVILQPH